VTTTARSAELSVFVFCLSIDCSTDVCLWIQTVGAVIGAGGENIRRLRSEVCFVIDPVAVNSIVMFDA